MCIANVRDYYNEFGPPAYLTQIAGVVVNYKFDHDSSSYNLEYSSKPTDYVKSTKIYLSNKRYPSGCDITCEGASSFSWNSEQVRIT
jgi:hypothetical protein